MKTERYSFSDVGVARWVLRTTKTLAQGERVIAWATKVERWFKAYLKAVRKARKAYGLTWQVAVSFVWQQMGKGRGVFSQIREALTTDEIRAKWSIGEWQFASLLERNSLGQITGQLVQIRPAKSKFALHAKRRVQRDSQEIKLNRAPMGY